MEVVKSKLSEEEYKAFISGDRTLVKKLLKENNVPVHRTEETHLDTHRNEDLNETHILAAN